MPTLEEFKRFSISKNFYAQVVSPLVLSGNVKNPDGLLELLKKVHCSLWHKSGFPEGFSGAVAGNFQEILDGYFTAVVAGHKVQYGSINGVGGDTVKEVVVGKGNRLATATTQFKVTASHAGEVREHICKAVWQLTGAGGELPDPHSDRVVEVVVQKADQVEPRSTDGPMSEFDADAWKRQIERALAHGYDKQQPAKTREELYAAVTKIYITTVERQFIFLIMNEPIYIGGGPSNRHKYVFNGGKMQQHWLYLTNEYWNSIKFKGYDMLQTQKHGVGSGVAKTPSELPVWRD